MDATSLVVTMSSSCSSIDPDFGDPVSFKHNWAVVAINVIDFQLSDALIFDIEQFSDHINNLRIALDPNSYIPGEFGVCYSLDCGKAFLNL